jgi:hypothetical protein
MVNSCFMYLHIQALAFKQKLLSTLGQQHFPSTPCPQTHTFSTTCIPTQTERNRVEISASFSLGQQDLSTCLVFVLCDILHQTSISAEWKA